MKKRFIAGVMSMVLVLGMLFSGEGVVYAKGKTYFNIKQGKLGDLNTQAMTFGKNDHYIYILGTAGGKPIIRVYKDKKIYGAPYYILGKKTNPSKEMHPNGITYYNSSLYVAMGTGIIYIISLKDNGTCNKTITCKMVGNDRKSSVNYSAYGIAYLNGNNFVVREKKNNTESKIIRYGVYKFNKKDKIAREDHLLNFKKDKKDSGYATGQDIGIKNDKSGDYLFLATSNKKENKKGNKYIYDNRIVKYEITEDNNIKYEKIIDSNRPNSKYTAYEVESMDFDKNGKMYYATNEKYKPNKKKEARDNDKVRVY